MKKPMHTNEDEEYLTEVIETLENNLNNLQESYDILENNFEVYKEETSAAIDKLNNGYNMMARELMNIHSKLYSTNNSLLQTNISAASKPYNIYSEKDLEAAMTFLRSTYIK
jgi:prefoldin subunit 5